MDTQEHKALIQEYKDKQRKLQELRAYAERFNAFNGFFHQGQCLKVQPSREKTKGNYKKTYFIVKNAFRSVLLVRLPLFGYQIEEGDTLYWAEPKEFSDEVSLLGIKKPTGALRLLKKTFKNAEGKSCPAMFFIEPELEIIKVRAQIVRLDEFLAGNRRIYQSSIEVLRLNSVTGRGHTTHRSLTKSSL